MPAPRVHSGTGHHLHFNIGSEEDMCAPFHVWLALSDTKSAVANRDPQNGSWFIATALLKAFREAKLIDIKSGIERLYRNDNFQELKTMGKPAPQVDRTIAGLARKRCHN